MADNEEVFKLDLDNANFIKGVSESIDKLKSIGNVENLSGLLTTLGTATVLVGSLTVAFLAAKAAVDMTEQGEKINQINNQFELLTKNAGISTETLRKGLEEAGAGLVDDTELLEAANKSLIELGENAAKGRDVLELARKTSLAFGGSVVDNFERINQAIATGNTRLLKHQGIIIDADKAYKEYAKSINSTVGALSESGKQEAILNAVLEKGKKNFADVTDAGMNVTNGFQRMKVAFKDIGDIINILIEQYIGPLLSKALGPLNELLKVIHDSLTEKFAKSAEFAGKSTSFLQGELVALTYKLEYYKKLSDQEKSMYGMAEAADELKNKIAALNRELKAREEKPKESKEDLDKKLEEESKFQKELSSIRNQELQEREKNEQSIEEVEANRVARKEQLALEYDAKIEEIEVNRRAGKITDQQADELEAQLIEVEYAKKAQLEEDLTDKKIKALDRFSQHSKSSSQQFAAGWKQMSLQAEKDLSNSANMGKAAFTALNKNAKSAFIAIGDGSKSAGEAMKGFLLNSIADIAEAQGEFLLASGIGTVNPVQIAEGGALLALSGLLRSQAGGGSSIGGGGGGSGGGATSAASTTTETAPSIAEAQKKSVNIAFNGPYYETEATKQRLVELIRENTDATNFNFNQPIGV